MSLDELKHHYRVIDMMLTAHCKLRDSNSRKAILIDLILLGSSIVLCAMVFFDSGILIQFKIDPQVVRLIIGICSGVVFFISLIILRMDWKGQAQKHAEATALLSRCKGECRRILKSEEKPTKENVSKVCEECLWTFKMLPAIPENKFLKLKILHKRKIQISKMVDNNPGCPLWVLRAKIFCIGFLNACRSKKDSETKNDENE
ncbi:MAG: hypothetical protein FVQ85_02875 [Planctomycetes bacterium]|nr:hypothetical protein [Planctomycetota bacterium]